MPAVTSNLLSALSAKIQNQPQNISNPVRQRSYQMELVSVRLISLKPVREFPFLNRSFITLEKL